MDINKIINLKIEYESLNIINDFLNMSQSHTHYEKALFKYAKIASELKLDELLINESKRYLKNIEQVKPTKYREEIYEILFNSALRLNKFELAFKYLNERKNLLKEMDKYKSTLDEIKYLKVKDENYLDKLIILKNDVIPNDILIFANEEIYHYYLKENMLDKALSILKELYDDTLNSKYENEMIKVYYKMEQYDKVVLNGTNLLNENSSNLYTVIFLISSLRIQKNYRRATSIEAEYEMAIENSSDYNLKLFAYNEIIKLYEDTNSTFSINLYKDKLKELNKLKKTEEKNKPIIKEKVKIKEIKTTKLVSDAKYLEHFKWINEWLVFSHNLKLNIRFREYLRDLFIKIDEKIQFDDVVIYLNNDFESNFYHYKKQRLFDKVVNDFYIENTIIKETMNNKGAIFSEPKNLFNNKNVLTQKPYSNDIKYVYSIYLSDNFVIVFYFDEVIKDPGLYFELLNGISLIINLRLLDEKNNKELNKDSKYLNNLLENPIMPMRELTISRSFYNEKAANLFNIDKNLHIELFLREVELEDAKVYEKNIIRLQNYPNETKIFTFKYQDLIILEYMFAIKNDNNVSIFSYFVNLTEYYNKENELDYKANYDLETNLLSKNNFVDNYKTYLKDKTSFVLIELNTNLRDIYGAERTNQFFIEFANLTKKHFNENDIFRYNNNQLLLVLNNNDIRSVTKILNDYFSIINNINPTTLKYEKFEAKAGFIRYPVSTTESNLNKIFKYLDVALNESKINKRHFTDFTFSLYEKDIFEQEVIDYLNEAIENKKISLRFNQIINIEKNTVLNYESEIYLPHINIDSKYLINIAKKRNKLIEFDYFHLEMVASYLEKVEQETGYYINITIPISDLTFYDNDFENYVTQIFKKYKVPLKHVKIFTKAKLIKQKELIKAEKLIKYGLSIETNSINTALNSNVMSLHLNYYDTKKHKNYYENLNKILEEENIDLIIRDVNSNTIKNQLQRLRIKYIGGTIYKKIESNELLNQIKGTINESN